MKLQKYMAHCGVDSRRACEKIIEQGRVTVNGEPAHLGMRVEEGDVVLLDGHELRLPDEKPVYIILNKPLDVVTTVKDTHDRKTVLDIVDVPQRVYPVGRLDMDSTGLILLTNDGELANKLSHPKYGVTKTYMARLRGNVSDADIQRLRDGVEIDGQMTHPAQVDVLARTVGSIRVKITIHEGRNRQIRKMCLKIGHPVLSLVRTEYAGLSIKGMLPGQWRELTGEEVGELKSKG